VSGQRAVWLTIFARVPHTQLTISSDKHKTSHLGKAHPSFPFRSHDAGSATGKPRELRAIHSPHAAPIHQSRR
jgi:hypothetical protein